MMMVHPIHSMESATTSHLFAMPVHVDLGGDDELLTCVPPLLCSPALHVLNVGNH